MTTLRFVLGDQLSHGLSSLSDLDAEQDIILMCEVRDECTYVKHHQKKIAFILSAMRHFAEELRDRGCRVDYRQLTCSDNQGSFQAELQAAVRRHDASRVIVTMPGEYRVWQDMQTWSDRLGIDVEIRPDDRFLCPPERFSDWAGDRKELRMEYFYREMRKQHGILMNGDRPEGGQWNFDKENRKPPPDDLAIPATYQARTDAITEAVLALVEAEFPDYRRHRRNACPRSWWNDSWRYRW